MQEKSALNKKENEMKNNSFIRQVLDIGMGTFFTIIIGVLTTPIITRLVDPNIYGEFAVFNTYATLGLTFFCMGMDQSFIRFYYQSKNKNEQSLLFKKCLSLPILIWLIGSVFLAVMSVIGNFKREYPLEIYLYIASLFIMILNRFSLNCLRVNNESKLYAMSNCLTKILYVSLAIIVIRMTQVSQLYALIVANVISLVIPTLIAIYKEKDYWIGSKNRIKDKSVKYEEILKYGAPLMISTSVFSLFQAVDRLSLNHYCNKTIVGIYASAQTLMTVFSIIQQSFNVVWGPKSIEQYEKGDNPEKYFSAVHKIIVVIMFAFGATILVFKNVFVLLLGEKYREAATIIPFLMLNPIMYTISETTNIGIVMKKKSIYQVYIVVISCVVNVIGNAFLIPIIGAKGAAVSTGISYVLFFTLRTYFSQKLMFVNFELKRLIIVLCLFLGMAYYHMMYSSLVIEILMYIGFISIILFVYKKDVLFIYDFVKSKLKR